MTYPRVLMASMWRDDLARQLVDRVEHLLAKAETYPALAWRWVVGDSADGTAQALRDLCVGYDVEVLEIITGIKGDDADSRLRRLSGTANHYLYNVQGYDYVCIHESDIVSPANLVNLLVAHAGHGRCPIAAWPMLELRPGYKVLYDVWALRKDNVHFKHSAPYHPAYRPDKPFTVDSAGTVLMFDAEDAAECIMARRAVLDLCWRLRELGRDIWVDPTLEVIQPHDLWQFHEITKEYA